MKLDFYKYHGTGNDFVLINNFDGSISLSTENIIKICDRHFGVGSDGLIILEKSNKAAYKMNFFNPDGSQSLCGNGARCTYQFAKDLGLISAEIEFEAIDGIHKAKMEYDSIAIGMNPVHKFEVSDQHYFIDTGSPHFIKYTNDLSNLEIIQEARKIRFNERFKDNGTNVNFVRAIGPDEVEMRTYERGVEDETLSCGTGVTAVALSYGLRNRGLNLVKVNTKGGELEVSFNYNDNIFSDIWLKGPAKMVYQGQITL